MYYPFRRKTISWIFSECPYVLSIPNIKRFVDSLFSLDCKTIRLVPPFLYEDRVQLKLNTVDLPPSSIRRVRRCRHRWNYSVLHGYRKACNASKLADNNILRKLLESPEDSVRAICAKKGFIVSRL